MKNHLPHHSPFHLTLSGQRDERLFLLSSQPVVGLADAQMLDVWFEQTVPSLGTPSLFSGVVAHAPYAVGRVPVAHVVAADYDEDDEDDWEEDEDWEDDEDDWEEEDDEDDWEEDEDWEDDEDDWEEDDEDYEDVEDDYEDVEDDYENEYEGMFEALSDWDDARSSSLKPGRRFRDEEREPRSRDKRKRPYRQQPRFNVENDSDVFDEDED